MKYLKYIIPNGLTAINLLCGSFAIVFTLEDYQLLPVYLILLAGLADLLDGLAAKLLNATSEFGKNLDSLADLISFGLAPSFLLYKILVMIFVNSGEGNFILEQSTLGQRLILFSAFTIVVFVALRLARYNVEADIKRSDFSGLPVPASAFFILSIWVVLIRTDNFLLQSMILNLAVILGIIVLLSFLMISRIPMLSLKFTSNGFIDNIWRYLLVIGVFLIVIVFYTLGDFGISTLFIVMVYYLLLSLLKAVITLKKTID